MRLQPKIEELLLALDLRGRWNDISDDLKSGAVQGLA